MLHIIRSAPDERTTRLMEMMTRDEQDTVIRLYEGPSNWDAVIDAIFEHEKNICWW